MSSLPTIIIVWESLEIPFIFLWGEVFSLKTLSPFIFLQFSKLQGQEINIVLSIKFGIRLFIVAKENGCTTILNPAPASEISNEFYNNIDFFTPNETEAEFYTGIKITNDQEAKQAADKLINLGIKKVIITLGEKGLFYSDGKEEIYLKANSVKAIDTTGAGDAFNGGLAYGLSKEKPIKECLKLANKVAGISTTKLGAGDAMPFSSDIKW